MNIKAWLGWACPCCLAEPQPILKWLPLRVWSPGFVTDFPDFKHKMAQGLDFKERNCPVSSHASKGWDFSPYNSIYTTTRLPKRCRFLSTSRDLWLKKQTNAPDSKKNASNTVIYHKHMNIWRKTQTRLQNRSERLLQKLGVVRLQRFHIRQGIAWFRTMEAESKRSQSSRGRIMRYNNVTHKYLIIDPDGGNQLTLSVWDWRSISILVGGWWQIAFWEGRWNKSSWLRRMREPSRCHIKPYESGSRKWEEVLFKECSARKKPTPRAVGSCW